MSKYDELIIKNPTVKEITVNGTQIREDGTKIHDWNKMQCACGELFVEKYKDDIYFIRENKNSGVWMKFNGVIYEQVQEAQLYDNVKICINEIESEPLQVPEDVTDDRKEKLMNDKWKAIKKMHNTREYKAILDQAKSHMIEQIENFDCYSLALPCLNGIDDYKKGEFIEKGPKCKPYKFTKTTKIKYGNSTKCENFLKVLDHMTCSDIDKQEDFLKLCAPLFIGRAHPQIMGYCIGNTRNGKSTILKPLLFMLGDYGQPLQPDVFAKRESGGHTDYIASLSTARGVVGSELADDKPIDAPTLKTVVGGDIVRASRKGKSAEDIKLQTNFLVCTNQPPFIPKIDNAVKERIIFVELNGETIPSNKRDDSLNDKLLQEIDSIYLLIRPYIMNMFDGDIIKAPVFSQVSQQYTREQWGNVDPFEDFYNSYWLPNLKEKHIYFIQPTDIKSKVHREFQNFIKEEYGQSSKILNYSPKTFYKLMLEALKFHGWTDNNYSKYWKAIDNTHQYSEYIVGTSIKGFFCPQLYQEFLEG